MNDKNNDKTCFQTLDRTLEPLNTLFFIAVYACNIYRVFLAVGQYQCLPLKLPLIAT